MFLRRENDYNTVPIGKREAHIESSNISIVACVYSCFYGEGMIMHVSKEGEMIITLFL